jgi:hypothetical protein
VGVGRPGAAASELGGAATIGLGGAVVTTRLGGAATIGLAVVTISLGGAATIELTGLGGAAQMEELMGLGQAAKLELRGLGSSRGTIELMGLGQAAKLERPSRSTIEHMGASRIQKRHRAARLSRGRGRDHRGYAQQRFIAFEGRDRKAPKVRQPRRQNKPHCAVVLHEG